MRRFTLLTRPGCHLCEEFEDELRQHFGNRLDVETAHVDADTAWRAAYGLRIPVLLDPAGCFVCDHTPDLAAVEAVLQTPA